MFSPSMAEKILELSKFMDSHIFKNMLDNLLNNVKQQHDLTKYDRDAQTIVKWTWYVFQDHSIIECKKLNDFSYEFNYKEQA
jgi:hypothetical protein